MKTSGDSPPQRLDSLTGIRAFAALLVFGVHVRDLGPLDGASSWNVLSSGMVGVSAFYILSGFVLTWTHKGTDSKTVFYQRRFARVYPPYAAAWLVAVAYLILISDQPFDIEWLWSLFLLQSWSPDQAIYFAVSAVFWSLSCEAFFYLIFPWIIGPIESLSTRAVAGFGVSIAVAVFFIAETTQPLMIGGASQWLLYVFPPTRALEFVLGILLALWVKRGMPVPLNLRAAAPAALLAALGASFGPETYMRVAITLIPFVWLIGAAARADLEGDWSPFRSSWVVTLGVWSYCFYLLQGIALGVFGSALDVIGHGWDTMSLPLVVSAIFVLLAGTTLAAFLLHHAVEHPLNERLRPRGRAAVNV